MKQQQKTHNFFAITKHHQFSLPSNLNKKNITINFLLPSRSKFHFNIPNINLLIFQMHNSLFFNRGQFYLIIQFYFNFLGSFYENFFFNVYYQLIFCYKYFVKIQIRPIYKKMRKILPIAVVTGFSLFSYSTIASKTRQNRQSTEDKHIDTLKAQQRAYNRQIEQTFKTGDQLFIKYDFSKAYTVRQYLWGMWERFWNEQNIDSFGYIYKNSNGVYVLFSQFGEQKVIPFDDFTFKIYLDRVSYQENWRKDIDFQNKLAQIVEKTKGEIQTQNIRQSVLDFANRTNFTLYGVKNYVTCFRLQHLGSTQSNTPKDIEILNPRIMKRIIELKKQQKLQQKEKEKK